MDPFLGETKQWGEFGKIASITSKHRVDTEWWKILKPEKVWNKYSVIDQAGPIVLRHDQKRFRTL